MAENRECSSASGCSKESCEGCSGSEQKTSFAADMNQYSSVKKVIGVVSGKGGVGKSSVTSMMAVAAQRKGYKTAVLDADITGPSIPRLFHIENERARGTEQLIYPVETAEGIKVMSLNLVVEKEDEAVIWRGPAITGIVNQFWTGVYWGELDYLIIDMPPGTGDVPLTVMQSIPIKGVVMVSIPQDMISMIVSKSINMARKMNIEVLGVIENMSYIQCPDCNKKIRMFDGENTEKFLKDMNVDLLGELPMHKSIVNYSIAEQNEDILDLFDPIIEKIIRKCKKKIIL